MENNHVYAAIDLKSFYASCECVFRGLDPLTTNLVVADASRTSKTICLAVTPSLKALGLKGRCRLFEVEQKVKEYNRMHHTSVEYIIATPQMAKYMEISSKIYSIYLKYISKNDIHVYSIDEVFMDITSYLSLYKMNAHDFCMMMIKDVLKNTGITATCGIATNLYLCKVAMDIVAKHCKPDQDGVRIAYLDEKMYREQLWDHKPLTSFWRVGKGISKRLENKGLYTMGDIARYSLSNEDWFYKEFGIDAEILIDHAWGYEPCGIEHIRNYKPSISSVSSGQVLHEPYSKEKGKVIVLEMIDDLVLDLIDKKLVTEGVVIDIGYDIENINDDYQGEIVVDHYGRKIPKGTHGSVTFDNPTNNAKVISAKVLELYNQIVLGYLTIRRVNMACTHLIDEDKAIVQNDLFSDNNVDDKEKDVSKAIIQIKKKYGKNAVIKGTNLKEGATMKERNKQIGGHKA